MIGKKPIDGKEICNACKGHCCKECAENYGYYYNSALRYENRSSHPKQFIDATAMLMLPLENMVEPLAIVEKYLGVKYDPKDGFGGASGCRIPREKRSKICLNYRCGDLKSALEGKFVHLPGARTKTVYRMNKGEFQKKVIRGPIPPPYIKVGQDDYVDNPAFKKVYEREYIPMTSLYRTLGELLSD